MEALPLMFLLFTSAVFTAVSGDTAAGGVEECGKQMQKVTPCLTYAQGKAAAPTAECCSSVKDIKESEPKCLCIIMQQTHNGSAQIKSLGIQEAKLLQLPSACKLQNASVSFCPKLLGLDPNSPDAAIFTNITSTTPTATSSGTSSPDKANSDSFGSKLQPLLSPSFIVLVLAISTVVI